MGYSEKEITNFERRKRMFKLTKDKQNNLQMEINSILERMESMTIESEGYEVALSNLERLYELKSKDGKFNISPDTMAVVAGNLIGLIMIIKHEELNIITSKALGFVLKGRA